MTSPQFSNFLTPLPPLVTPVMPWKSPQIAIFYTPLPPPSGVTSFMDDPLGNFTQRAIHENASILLSFVILPFNRGIYFDYDFPFWGVDLS